MRLRIIALLGQTNSTSMSDLPKGKHERCCAAIPPEYLKFHQLRSLGRRQEALKHPKFRT
jgi:hypothetical protein